MKTTLIILNYNDAERTGKLCKAVREYRSIDRIVIVDNCSTDDSFLRLSQLKDAKTAVILSPENGGYAKGNNFGILYALKNYSPDVIFIANPDVYFTDETALAMAEVFQNKAEQIKSNSHEPNASNEKIGVCAPLVRQGTNAWDLPYFAGILESLFLVAFTLHKKRIRRGILKSPYPLVKVGVVEGSFLAVSSAAYKKAHGFDERTFLYAEEIIFAKRLKKAGYAEYVLKDHYYDHQHSASIKKIYHSKKAAAFPHFRDSFRIYNKYYLHTGAIKNIIFNFCWTLGLFERKLYDAVKNRLTKHDVI